MHLLDPFWNMPPLVWDPDTKQGISQVERVQRRGAHYVLNRHRNHSSGDAH